MPTEEEQIQARRDAQRERKLAALAKGQSRGRQTRTSPLARRQRAKRALAASKKASTEALRKLEEAASVSLEKDETNRRRFLDRAIEGQTTDSNQ
jgi:hypothetical protein